MTKTMNNMNDTRQVRRMTAGGHSGFTGKGFTLIELLVTIGVIAVLMGIVLPVLSNVRQSFRTVSCGNNIGLIAQGFVSYGMDHNGWLPAASMNEYSGRSQGSPRGLYVGNRELNSKEVNVRSNGQGQYHGQGLLLASDYVLNTDIFLCPEETYAFGGNKRANLPEETTSSISPKDRSNYFSSYSYRGGTLSKKKTAEGPLNMSRNSGGLAILADWAEFSENDTPHGYAHNVAYLDTHVKFHQFDKPIVKGSDMTALWKELNAFWD